MNKARGLTVVGTSLFLAAANSHAQPTNLTDKLYLDVSAGPAFQQNISIKDGTGFGDGGDVSFDTGLRAGVDVGYNFNQSFAVELDAGVIRNTINQIGIQPLSPVGATAELDEIPLLVNGLYHFPLPGAFKPYVGAGVGVVVGIFDGSNIPGFYFSYPPGSSTAYSDTDLTFAYQIEAGFKYSVGKHMDFGLAYKVVGTSDHSWTDNNITLKTGGTMTHAIMATFTWRF